MPKQKLIDLDPALNRLRRIFHDADIEFEIMQVTIQVPGQPAGPNATEYTFKVDLGYPKKYLASFLLTYTEIDKAKSDQALAIVVAWRSDCAIRSLLQETGRTE